MVTPPGENTPEPAVTAIVLAAGESKRMHRPKMVLPWDSTTIIGKVITTLDESEVSELVIVTGGFRSMVENELGNLTMRKHFRIVYNPHYQDGEMLCSVQAGLNVASARAEAALIVLGDQPQIECKTVNLITQEFAITRSNLIVPSYRNRRGHPWLIAREKWGDIVSLKPPETLRDYLNLNSDRIHYLSIPSDTILNDIDTPEDYQHFRKE